jgi:hypothetical protein
MPFRVVWHQSALDQLASIWLKSDNRRAVTDSANAIDRTLSEDPEHSTAPVGDQMRVLHRPPLDVLVDILVDQKLVVIVMVHEVRPDRN